MVKILTVSQRSGCVACYIGCKFSLCFIFSSYFIYLFISVCGGLGDGVGRKMELHDLD